jgi:hypothetical protein
MDGVPFALASKTETAGGAKVTTPVPTPAPASKMRTCTSLLQRLRSRLQLRSNV